MISILSILAVVSAAAVDAEATLTEPAIDCPLVAGEFRSEPVGCGPIIVPLTTATPTS